MAKKLKIASKKIPFLKDLNCRSVHHDVVLNYLSLRRSISMVKLNRIFDLIIYSHINEIIIFICIYKP